MLSPRVPRRLLAFKLTSLMHTMSVVVSLTTTNPFLFTINKPFSIIPPLSYASYTLQLSHPSDQPPLSDPPDAITVRATMLPTGKATIEHLHQLFSKPGPHVFCDAVLNISLVGPTSPSSSSLKFPNHATYSPNHIRMHETAAHEAAQTSRGMRQRQCCCGFDARRHGRDHDGGIPHVARN